MPRKFFSVLKSRTGMERLSKEQMEGIRGLVRKAHEWDMQKMGGHSQAARKMSEEEYGKLWSMDSYVIHDSDKEKLRNLDQKTVFNNVLWLSRNTDKIDPGMKRFLGMHVWVINHWIQTVGATTVRKFLRENNYSGEFVYFLYRYFNL